jgi:gag-polyprotein putative aspartyl protease
MPCLSGQFQAGVGPLVNLGVSKAGSISPQAGTASAKGFPALIDTGASMTCISPAVAQALALRPIGRRPMVSATHAIPVNAYMVDLILPLGGASYVVPTIQVLEFSSHAASPFQILLGRDILCRGTLNISFDGHFTFCI